MSLPPKPRRGDVWLADLDKVRPVIVLTRDPIASALNAVIVGAVTRRVRGLSTEVPVGRQEGLAVDSVVNLDNTQLVAHERLMRRLGRVQPSTMQQICGALARAVGCE